MTKQIFKRAKEKFEGLLPELIEQHNGKYVVIINDNVEIGNDEDLLLKRVIDKYGYQTMYLSKITGDEQPAMRLRSPKLSRRKHGRGSRKV